MVRSQAAGKWDQFDVEVLVRQSMAIVGYGEIGRSAAKRREGAGDESLCDSPAAGIAER